jgi:hypothetical protein
MSTLKLHEEARTIATFLNAYLATCQRMADRFTDREDIFPEHILSPFAIKAYSCKDGLIIDFVQPAQETTLDVAPFSFATVGQVLAHITFGLFSFGGEAPVGSSRAKPAFRMMASSIENKATAQKRAVHDIQLWRGRDMEALSMAAAESLAVGDVQDWLMTYAISGSDKPLPSAVLDSLQKILDEYERLVDDDATPESRLQSFLTDHPLLLTPVLEQVIPKQQIGCGKEYEIDFVIRQEADRYLVVEIEKPSTPILTRRGDFTAPFQHAERQMLDFLGWIDENLHTARTAMPGIANPRGLVVVGRRRDLDSKGLLRLATKNAATRARYEFLTFDDLLNQGRLVIKTFRSLGR